MLLENCFALTCCSNSFNLCCLWHFHKRYSYFSVSLNSEQKLNRSCEGVIIQMATEHIWEQDDWHVTTEKQLITATKMFCTGIELSVGWINNTVVKCSLLIDRNFNQKYMYYETLSTLTLWLVFLLGKVLSFGVHTWVENCLLEHRDKSTIQTMTCFLFLKLQKAWELV